MPTELVYRDDAYDGRSPRAWSRPRPRAWCWTAPNFYARAGGQPAMSGVLRWAGGEMAVGEAVKGPDDTVLHLPAPGAALPDAGTAVTAVLDWDAGHRFMRLHTSMHLLCSLIPGAGVTGGQIAVEKARLDFDLPEPPTKEALTKRCRAGRRRTTRSARPGSARRSWTPTLASCARCRCSRRAARGASAWCASAT